MFKNNLFLLRATMVFAGILLVFNSILALSQQVNPTLYQEMRWRMIGPFRGGRTLTATGVPGQPYTWYFGAVAGGVWKSIDGGNTWAPIFDQQPIASIGALAVAPSDPNIIYVGTGEADMRSDISFGNGVYKSTDAGRTWTHLGLSDTRQIGRILVDPRDPNSVLVAALGHAYGPNAERGVFRTADGGRTWHKVLYKDENTGAIDLAADPADFNIIYAALWNAHRTPWSQYPPVNGRGSGLYRSEDGGLTWKQVTGNGLPGGDWGRIGIAIAKGRGVRRIYVLIEANEGGLFRSDDDGKSWQRVGTDRRIRNRLWYFSGVTVDPENPDIVYLPNVSVYRSLDGGHSFESFKGAPGGDDYHSLWIDPQNHKRMILASDQGATISVDGGRSWSSWYNQPTAQFYHVSTDSQFPYYVYGAQQDSGTVRILSRSDYGSITFRDWQPIGAGEAGYIVPDPSDANVVYGGETKGALFHFDQRNHQSREISPSVAEDWELAMPARALRFTFTSPLAVSPFDPHTLYFGSQYLLKTSDQGSSWQRISPDLTGASSQRSSAAEPLTFDNARQQGYGVVYSIAPSPLKPGQIWTGSDSGLIYLTKDDGKTWTDVTPQGLGAWSKISVIEASPFDPGTAYVAVDRHRLDDYRPYIVRTRDFGKSWVEITNGIAAPAFVHAVREDPACRGLLYAGTETGIYVSFDDGDHWQSLQLNLPITPVHDLVVKDDDLVVATHGRSFWILDDLTPLRQASSQVAGSEAYLFRPVAAIRLRNANRDTPLPAEVPAGQNPPPGAILDYYLGAEPSGEITLEIVDAHGTVVRRFSSADRYQPPDTPAPFPDYWFRAPKPLSRTAGMHRFVWDLRYPTLRMIEPEYSSAVAFGENVPSKAAGALVVPGEYQVRFTVAGHTYSQPLTIKLDPRVRVSPSELAQQLELETQISQALGESYGSFRQAEQLSAQLKTASGRAPAKALQTAAEILQRKAQALAGEEEQTTESQEKLSIPPTFRSVNQALASEMAAVSSADAAPTEQAREAFAATRRQLEALLRAWNEVLAKDVVGYNRMAAQAGVPRLDLGHSK